MKIDSIDKIKLLTIFLFINFIQTSYLHSEEIPQESQSQTQDLDNSQDQNLDHTPEISVGLDTYSSTSSIRYPDDQRPYVTQAAKANQFSVNHALVNIAKETNYYRYAIGLHAGTYVDRNYILEPEAYRPLYQAWAGYALMKSLWLDIGIFPSHIGGESAISFQNFNYTRSLVAENSPYYETGMRLVWNPWDDLKVALYILNGWQRIRESNRDKAVGTEVQYRLSENWSLNYSTFIGNEAENSEQRQTRYFQDFYIKGKFKDWWEVYAIYDLGFQRRPTTSWTDELLYIDLKLNRASREVYYRWQGFALQSYFHLHTQWKLGVRLEGFTDENGVVM